MWSEVPSDRVEVAPGADALLAVGGGSAIDTAKAASSATGLPLVSVPTTYSGAEWTTGFGIRTRRRRIVGGGGGARPRRDRLRRRPDARPAARRDGRHGAERARALRRGALRRSHRARATRCAFEGAELIARWLPRVVEAPHDLEARDRLLHGAAAAGEALGARRARARPRDGAGARRHLRPAARRDERAHAPAGASLQRAFVPDAVARFGAAIGAADDPAAKVEELARLGGFERLRDFGVPEDELAGSRRDWPPGATGTSANPRPATPAEIESAAPIDLLISVANRID